MIKTFSFLAALLAAPAVFAQGVTIATSSSSPTPTASISVSPTTINVGQSADINWSSTNSPSCAGTGFSTGSGNPSQSTPPGVPVTPASAGTYTYSVNCTGAVASASLTVNSGGGGGGGACAGGDSGFVPAGYKCVPTSTDEFDGDLSKWRVTGTSGGCTISGGNLHLNSTTGTVSCGMGSQFPIPDAPSYIEFRRRAPVSGFAIYQAWTAGCWSQFGGTCNGEETDADMGVFNGCHPASGDFSICSGYEDWVNGTNTFGSFNSLGGPNVYDGNYHIIGIQRLPDPAPSGTVNIFTDGVLRGSIPTNTESDNRWVFPSQHLQPGGWDNGFTTGAHDYLQIDLFCDAANPDTQCPGTTTVDYDYVRVYTPTGLPNGY